MFFLSPSGFIFNCSKSACPRLLCSPVISLCTEAGQSVLTWSGRTPGRQSSRARPSRPPFPTGPAGAARLPVWARDKADRGVFVKSRLRAPPLFSFCPNSPSELEHLRKFLCQEVQEERRKGYVSFFLKIILCHLFYSKLLLEIRTAMYLCVESAKTERHVEIL